MDVKRFKFLYLPAQTAEERGKSQLTDMYHKNIINELNLNEWHVSCII